jgi:superoxide dismutase, Fe-Mn family
MTYEAKDFTHLLGTPGFSDKLLETHLKLYGGYVANTNKVLELLESLEVGTPQWAEVKRRFGWEFNGMRLHELYFGNLKKEKTTLPDDAPLMKAIIDSFGSGKACHDNFVSAGKLRGIGWVVMCYDPVIKKIFNVWINEHDVGHLAGCVPLLVMDVFEHAFIMDYNMDRASYINAFVEAIDWDVVQERFNSVQ